MEIEAIRPMARTARDLELFDACFAANAAPRDRAVLRWQYLDNPTGALFVDFATASADRLAAIYASIPVVFRVAGERRLGIQSVDTMTDREFRGRGLFLRLAQATYARAADAGVALVYGTPNGNSAHGFFQRLGWRDLNPVPFLIRPLRARWVLEKLKLARAAAWLPELRLPVGRGRADARRIERFDDRFTRLWGAFARGIGVAVERDAPYLNWRLADKPGEDYRSFAVGDGELAAFTSHCIKQKERSRIGYIMEALCARGGARALGGLLRGALADMAASGADGALAWCLPHSPTFASFLRAGFVPFPRRLWPIELHLGARSFDPAVAAQVHDRRAWYLSYLDCDTV
jgi:GNAT superfamily N-acetyltransferase